MHTGRLAATDVRGVGAHSMTADPFLTATAALGLGLPVVPPMEDGTKRPMMAWKKYQTELPTADDLHRWYREEAHTGVGIITGVKGVEMWEVEGRASALIPRLKEECQKTGLGDLWKSIVDGYCEKTPGGGFHVLYRTSRPKTEKLAVNEAGECMIETKGLGGYTIIAPTYGAVHSTGQPWVLTRGSLDSMAAITDEERQEFHELCRSFGFHPAVASPRGAAITADDDLRPGDLYNRTAIWSEILEPHGWVCLHTASDGNQHWRRPGKDRGTSATVSEDGNGVLYVFSSSAAPFEGERAYSRFGAFALLEHGGDYSSAARDLRQRFPATHGHPSTAPDPAPGIPEGLVEIDWVQFARGTSKERDFLVEPVLPAGRQVAIFSVAKTGKSLLALEIAAALATGRAILGSVASDPISVIYMDYEMTEDDLRERLEDLGYTLDEVDLSHLHYYLLPSLPGLDTPEGGDTMEALVRHHSAVLVVIDTMARAVGGEENYSDTYRGFYTHTGLRLKAMQTTLLRLDHQGKDPGRGQRGSSSKADDVDVVFRLNHTEGEHYKLARTHTRVSWVPDEVLIHREEEPVLRHQFLSMGVPAGTGEVAKILEQLEVPLDASISMAMAALRRGGEGRRKSVVLAAIKYRRDRS